MKRSPRANIAFLMSLAFLDGCGGSLGGNPEKDQQIVENPAGTEGGSLSFAITDAPVAEARNVFVTIENLSVLKEDGEWLTIPLEQSAEIDLLAYQNGLSTPLASITAIPEGTYNQTRLILSETSPSRLVDLEGIEHELKVPSGSESGLKIASPIVIGPGGSKAMVIDFDLRKSIKKTGNGAQGNSKYLLKPVLRMVEKEATGSIESSGTDGDVICAYATAAEADEDDSCGAAEAAAVVSESKFVISFLPAGTYSLRIFRNGAFLQDISAVAVKARTASAVDDYP